MYLSRGNNKVRQGTTERAVHRTGSGKKFAPVAGTASEKTGDNHKMDAPSMLGNDTFTPQGFTDQQLQVAIESILEGISDGVFTVNRDLQITAFNQAAEKITSISRGKAIGQSCATVFRSSLCGTNCPLRKTLATNIPVLNRCASIINAEGLYIPVKVSTTLVRNQDNEVVGAVETFQDLRLISAPAGKSNGHVLFDVLVTRNQHMGKIINLLLGVAESSKNVLIEGEEGAGKEMLARTIHGFGPQKQRPFVVFNCRGPAGKPFPPEALADRSSILTDAAYLDISRGIALPAGSTLFLRELDTASIGLQECLLRFLLELDPRHEDSGNVPTRDVRVISSTTENLFHLVLQGSFRRDLYSRLSPLKLALPPLRKRREDIPLLTDNFISYFNQIQHKSVTGVCQETMSLLMNYTFPGNIRELKGIIEQAFVSCERGNITPAQLPEVLRTNHSAHTDPYGMELVVQTAEAQAIMAALRRNHYHRQAAACELGIHKSTFFRKIKRLGIILPQEDGRFRDTDKGHPW